MDGVVDEEDIQQVEGPSEQYGGSWDNRWVAGTALDDAEPVREAAGRYRETEDVGVVMDTREAEGTDSGVEEGQGNMQDGERERSGSIVRHDNGSRGRAGALLTWEEDLGETPTAGALVRGRFCVDSESRGGGGGIWDDDKGKLPPGCPKGGSCLGGWSWLFGTTGEWWERCICMDEG